MSCDLLEILDARYPEDVHGRYTPERFKTLLPGCNKKDVHPALNGCRNDFTQVPGGESGADKPVQTSAFLGIIHSIAVAMKHR